MFRLVVLLALASLAASQYQGKPQNAAILSEQRYLSGDGTFGAAYNQEDGIDFKEESDAEGNRRGSYSYVDPTGQRRTVSYTAGKDGFRATGDHLPVAPAAPAPVAPQPQYNPAPQQYQQPQQYNQQQYQQPQQYNQQQYQQPQQQYQQQYQQPQQYQQQYTTTTPNPHRFYPPGKLSLNRTPDGFSYTFNKS